MATAYFDCFSGISGDMSLAALIHLGLNVRDLKEALLLLSPPGLEIEVREATRGPVSGILLNFSFTREAESPATPARIREILGKSGLNDAVKEKSLRVFARLFEAEARVHGTTPDEVHLHEAGGWDTVADVVGVVFGLEAMKIDKVLASRVPLGSGSVDTSHGTLPVPAPATVELLRGVPVYGGSFDFEVTTPTGAALISELAEGFGPCPAMRVSGVGYGLGSKDPAGGLPNALRVILGDEAPGLVREEIAVLEASLDDMNPQYFDHLMELLFEAGALDVSLVPAQMKKNRPGTLLRVVAEQSLATHLAELVLKETTTLGVRMTGAERLALKREVITVETSFGPARVKVAHLPDGETRLFPEYDDLKKIARERGVPILEVERAVILAAAPGEEDEGE